MLAKSVVELAMGRELDERGDHLAPARVGHTDDGGVDHRGVLAQDLFHLFGIHLLAAGVDARGASPQQLDAAVDPHPGAIAGRRVADTVDLAEHAHGRVGVVEVAEREAARDREHAVLTGAGHHVASVVGEDATLSFAANDVGTEAWSRVTVERVIIASEAPSVSTIVSPGIRSSNACLLAALNAMPDDTIARSDDRSSARTSSRSRVSMSGRAKVSPTMLITATRSHATSRQSSAASRRSSSRSTTVPPPLNVAVAMPSAVACTNGEAGRRVAARFPARIAVDGSGGSVPGRAASHPCR